MNWWKIIQQDATRKRLYEIYRVLTPTFAIGGIVAYFVLPIEIAQICGIGFLWSAFGTVLNMPVKG